MRRSTNRTRLALVLAALVTLAACSGGGDEEAVEADATAAAGERDTAGAGADGAVSTTAPAGADTTVDDGGAAPDGSTDPADTAPTTTATPTGSEGTTPEQTGGSDGQAGSGSTTTAAGPTAPSRPIVPRSGTYTYERTVTNDEGSQTDTTDAVVERLSGDDDAGRVQLTVDSDQGTLTNDATVSDAGTLVERSVIDSPLGEVECDWEPDWLLNGPFAEGSTWDIDTSCSDTATGLEVDVSMTGSGRVVGFEHVDVNGVSVNTWVLETTTVTDFTVSSPTINGSQHTESTSRSWIDPAIGMQVRNVTESDDSGDFQNGKSTTVTDFVRFTA